jgi:hypothetical protein
LLSRVGVAIAFAAGGGASFAEWLFFVTFHSSNPKLTQMLVSLEAEQSCRRCGFAKMYAF